MVIRTLQDQIDSSVFPYFTIFHPQQIVNWSLDIYGRPYWVLVREERDGNQDPYNYDSQNLTQVNYRLWTVNEWVLYNGEGPGDAQSSPITMGPGADRMCSQ